MCSKELRCTRDGQLLELQTNDRTKTSRCQGIYLLSKLACDFLNALDGQGKIAVVGFLDERRRWDVEEIRASSYFRRVGDNRINLYQLILQFPMIIQDFLSLFNTDVNGIGEILTIINSRVAQVFQLFFARRRWRDVQHFHGILERKRPMLS